MPAPTVDITTRLKINLADLKTNATTSYYITNRPVDNGNGYLPILKSLNNFGAAMSGYMPQTVTGSATIDNRPGVLGYQRRFSDLFERETPIDQLCVISWAATAIGDTPGSFTNLALGYVRNWRIQGDDLVITFESSSVPKTVVTKAVNGIEFPDAPDSSFGQELPIVFGENIQTKAIKTTDSDTAPKFSYASFLGPEFRNVGVQAYYTKDRTGRFVQVASASSADTAVYSQTTGGSNQSVNASAGDTAMGLDANMREAGFVLQHAFGTTPYVITHVGVRSNTEGASYDGSTGTATLKLYTRDTTTNLPGDLLASAQVDMATINTAVSAAAGSQVEILFTLNRPVILTETNGYIVTLVVDTAERFFADFANYWNVRYDRAGSFYGVQKVQGVSNTTKLNNYHLTASLQNLDHKLYGLAFSDIYGSTSTINESGIGHSYFTVTQKTGGTCDLSDLDFIVSINGLKDNDGTVTGVSNALITAPHYACYVLSMGWSGTAWTGSAAAPVFTTTHTQLTTAGINYREIAGRSDGRQTADSLMQEICRSTGCRIAQVNHLIGTLGLWAWGTTAAVSATLGDEDVTIESVDAVSTQGVINYVDIRYARALIQVDPFVAAITGEQAPYTGHFRPQNDAHFTEITELSRNLYGLRPLDNPQFNFINDEESARFIADYYCRVFTHPATLVTLSAPLYKYQDFYNSIDLLSIIGIVHPKLPAYFGTSAKANNPTYSGQEADILPTGYFKRASYYRAQVESKLISFQGVNHPTMRLVCRLLTNPYDLT